MVASPSQPLTARELYQALHRRFDEALARLAGGPALVPALLGLAFEQLELASEPDPDAPLPPSAPACAPGCASCCQLRVLASAPEVFLMARFLRRVVPPLAERGIDLIAPLREVQAATQGLSEFGRARRRQPCAFVVQGRCLVYPVRTLACRAHMSLSQQACIDAASGAIVAVPHDEARRVARGLVQNALQSALREAGLSWQVYELHHALVLAWDGDDAEAAWAAGLDPLAAAAVDDVPRTEMAAVFDQLRPVAR
ncbi:MAG TPA: YkgJ family cysteine cluster protein [Roseateles sp.]